MYIFDDNDSHYDINYHYHLVKKMKTLQKRRYRLQRFMFRRTLVREALLKLLSRTSKHLSAREIYDMLVKAYPGIGLSTVYRTLNFLSQKGFINKLDIGEGQSRYEYKSKEDDVHHHVICTKCGKIIDYGDFTDEEMEMIRKTENNISGKYNFLVQDYSIEFYGICDGCR